MVSERHRPRPFVVAIDGPAAAGKGTLGRRLAARFGLAYLDTGSLYRAAALGVIEAGGDPADPVAAAAAARQVDAARLADPRLRGETVAAASSVVAAIPAVREALLDFQRRFAAAPPAPFRGAVLDGRDIGSVVCPQAAVKIFLDASAEARAQRRVEELRVRGLPAIYDAVLEDMRKRDARDTERSAAPLKPAPGAHLIDTTRLDAEQVLDQVADIVARALAQLP
jgi:CMP/dCMP kinase